MKKKSVGLKLFMFFIFLLLLISIPFILKYIFPDVYEKSIGTWLEGVQPSNVSLNLSFNASNNELVSAISDLEARYFEDIGALKLQLSSQGGDVEKLKNTDSKTGLLVGSLIFILSLSIIALILVLKKNKNPFGINKLSIDKATLKVIKILEEQNFYTLQTRSMAFSLKEKPDVQIYFIECCNEPLPDEGFNLNKRHNYRCHTIACLNNDFEHSRQEYSWTNIDNAINEFIKKKPFGLTLSQGKSADSVLDKLDEFKRQEQIKKEFEGLTR